MRGNSPRRDNTTEVGTRKQVPVVFCPRLDSVVPIARSRSTTAQKRGAPARRSETPPAPSRRRGETEGTSKPPAERERSTTPEPARRGRSTSPRDKREVRRLDAWVLRGGRGGAGG